MTPARWILLVVVLLALLLLSVGAVFLSFLATPQGDPERGPVLVTIEEGSDARAVAEALEEADVVAPAWAFLRLMQYSDVDRQIHAGDYSFETGLTPPQVLERLAEGRVELISVTLPEGLDIEESARAVAAAGIASEEALLEAFRDASHLDGIDEEALSLEGYLFPETYRFARSVSAQDVASTFVGHFVERFLVPHREAIESSGFTLREIVGLASLVEKETGLAEERPRIAGVFHERLERGMKLQCDPTVIYAMKRAGTWEGNIRRRDLGLDDPYNTYVYAGIPPGPIASPGLDALVAVLEPVRDGHLYFVSRGDGSHEFTKTLRDHINAVRRYQLNKAR